jgi:hypothetical protein
MEGVTLGTRIELSFILTLFWNAVVLIGSVWALWGKVDKRLSLMEDRIHNNGFASKTDMIQAKSDINSLKNRAYRNSTRISVIESVCSKEHGTLPSREKHDDYAEDE